MSSHEGHVVGPQCSSTEHRLCVVIDAPPPQPPIPFNHSHLVGFLLPGIFISVDSPPVPLLAGFGWLLCRLSPGCPQVVLKRSPEADAFLGFRLKRSPGPSPDLFLRTGLQK